MSGNLNNRVTRLEKEGHGEGRTLMVWGEIGESRKAAMQRFSMSRGIEPGENDRVIFVGWAGAFPDES